MANAPKNQHYVPRFLLRNFSDAGGNSIWAFDKDAHKRGWKTVDKKSIKSVASEDFFYDSSEQEKSSLENELGKIESKVAPVISKLINGKDLCVLNSTEKETIALFISSQRMRTKVNQNKAIDFSGVFNRTVQGFLSEVMDVSQIEFEQNGREIWLDLIADSESFVPIVLRKKWLLFISSENLLISDNPVVLYNRVRHSLVRGTLGLNSDGIEIYLPLSNFMLLGLFCERVHGHVEEGTYAMEPGNAEFANSLQVDQSLRFVFSSNSDFKLVFDMLENTGNG